MKIILKNILFYNLLKMAQQSHFECANMGNYYIFIVRLDFFLLHYIIHWGIITATAEAYLNHIRSESIMSKKALARKNTFASKVRYWLNAPSRAMMAAYMAITASMASVAPTFCSGSTSSSTGLGSTDMNSLFSSMVGIICTIAFYVGAIIIVGGVFNWVLAQKDENADGQSRAIKFIVCGFALVALKVIVQPLINNLGLSI